MFAEGINVDNKFKTRLIGRMQAGALVLAMAAAATSAQALVININAVSGGGLSTGTNAAAALAAFNRAADRWESYLTDNVTVQITADLRNLGSSTVIGQAGSTMLRGGFNMVRNAMVADASNEADDAILASLPTWSQFQAARPVGIGLLNAISLTQANAMALGFARQTASDATIEFNSGFSFDYNNRDGVVGMDFESVAMHELGHALGFVSVIDQIDSMKKNGQTGNVAVNPLDLFRFGSTANPSTNAEFTSFRRELNPGALAYYDDLGVELRLSTGYSTGDGRQASHWRDDSLSGVLLGVMDPTLAYKSILPMTENDRRVFDRIGWEYTGGSSGGGGSTALTASNSQRLRLEADDVPEPETLALLLAGLLGVHLTRRRLFQ